MKAEYRIINKEVVRCTINRGERAPYEKWTLFKENQLLTLEEVRELLENAYRAGGRHARMHMEHTLQGMKDY